MKELIDTTQPPLGLDQAFPEEELWVLCLGREFLCGPENTDLWDLMDAYKTEADAWAGLLFAAEKYKTTNQDESILSFRPERAKFDDLRTDPRCADIRGVAVLDREGKEITRRYWD